MKRNLPCQRRPPDLWLGRGFDSFTRSPSGTPRLSARAINSWSVTQHNWASIFESVPRLRSSRRTVLRTVNSWSWLVGVMGTASKRFDYDRPFLRRANEAVLPKGAEYAWMVLLDYGHEYAENRLDLLIMPLMDLAVRTRYPKDGDPTKGPVKLLSIDPASGWVADNTTWRSGLTRIVPASQFKGDTGHSIWLQNEDVAFIYRAYATHNNPIAITSPGPCGPGTPALDSGSEVPITVDASQFPNWRKLEFYDGAKQLGTVTAVPAHFTATNLTPGYHVSSVLGTDAARTVRTSDPRMVVVRPLP